MDDMEDDDRYNNNPKPYSLNHQHPHNSSSSSHRRKIHIRNSPYSHRQPPPPPLANRYHDDDDQDDDDDDDAIDDVEEYQNDAVLEVEQQQQYHNGFEWHPKKRKLKNLDYEFAPRVKYPTPPPPQTNRFGSGSGSRPSPEEESWTEHAVFVLLEVWGDRFLQLGRKSLRSEDWADVAQKVSEESKIERSEKQCRNMLDMLKRKYKKEKARIEEMGGGGGSKWGYFKKMEMLMANSTRQESGLACGVDNGEYVFMNTRVYLEKSNGFDEMRDSPGESETDDDEEEEENVGGNGVENGFPGLPRFGGGGVGVGGGGLRGSSYSVLADSIHKFGEIYENIESSKRQQMMELEKMRREFNKEMELQKKQILERAHAEIAKIQEANDDEDDEDDDTDDASGEELSE